jgi:hypothetical protein
MSLTVDDLVEQVRSQLDETNTANVTDPELIQALNRGQRKASNMTARYFRDLMWAQTVVTTEAARTTYPIPDEAYGRRINHCTVQIQSIPYPLKRISNAEKHNYNIDSQAQRPYYYTVTKNTLEIYPPPAPGLPINVHYTAKPEDMVTNQGRIESVNTGSNYILVDELGSDVSTTSTGFNSYVNFVDYITGAVKGTLQVSAIDTNTKQITFKTTGLTRTTVLGKTIGTAIPSDVEPDDFISIVTGTCVPELPEAYIDFLMQSAIVDIRRRFGEPAEEEYRHYKELEAEIKKMWIGRESQNRIRKASTHWKGPFSTEVRRLFS